MHSVVFCLLLLISVIYAQKFGLFGIITDFAGENTETIVRTVTVDPNTGQTLRIITNFIYVGGSATYDGISALDTDKGQFYYVTDATSFLYNVDLGKQSLLPTISMGLDYVGTFAYDSSNKRLLVWGLATDQQTKKTSNYLLSYPTGNTGAASLVTQFQNIQELVGSTLDAKNQIFYFMAYNNSKEYVGSYNINTKVTSNLVEPSCNITGQYVFAYDSFTYDPNGGLRAVAETTNPLKYFYVTLDVKGGCVAYPINPSAFGIATCFSFDPQSPNLYLGWAPDGPGKIITFNTKTMSITKEVALSDGFVLEDLTVAYI